jgi:hypothetical protein
MLIQSLQQNRLMEDKSNLIETLFERSEEYIKTSFELIKLKILKKNHRSGFFNNFAFVINFFHIYVSSFPKHLGYRCGLGKCATKFTTVFL